MIRVLLLSVLLTGCTQVRYVPTTLELPPPPPRVYGEPLTKDEYKFMREYAEETLKKLESGIQAHRNREEILEAMVCSTRQPPCP